MKVTQVIAVMLGIFGALMILLQMNTYLAGSWTTISQNVSRFAVALFAFGVMLLAAFYGARR